MGPLTFTAWQFAIAGALCAAGPVVIHLLNRRRYRVVQWAAMEFLRQAIQRNRKILQIRDLVLLVVRTLAVLLFGLALARPYFAARHEEFDQRQPLHAVIVIDNSLSMAYESLEGTLLDKAKERARQFIEKLPAGSRISIIPACGSRSAVSVDPYGTKEGAVEALERIEIVDRSANLLQAANEARRACESAPELAKRIVFIGDQQELNWRDLRSGDALKDLPPMQIVSVAPLAWENSWVSDVRLQDGLADVETPATVVVELRHRGSAPRRNVQVRLSMGESLLGEKTVTLEPGDAAREVEFECIFSGLRDLPQPDRPVFVPLRAWIAPDRLAADDERFLAAPVVAALPVVFVDQFGPQLEDPIKGRLGETRHLRKLLAPRTSRSDAPRQLIGVRHVAAAEVTRDLLADARLVVVAGLRDPAGLVPLLREYVQQGGQLFIAAGAEFDPAAWQEAAWLDGGGVLPLPLAREPLGKTPEESSTEVRPFFLDYESMAGEAYFHLSGVGEAQLRELYAEPFFFKAVAVDASSSTIEAWMLAETRRLTENAGPAAQPRWLVWADAANAGEESEEEEPWFVDPDERARQVETAVLAAAPRVLARYDLAGRPPLLVARRIGRGEVLFCSTGLLSPWNTLPKTNAVLIFDRILRAMIQSTLPRRNLSPTQQFILPLPPGEQNVSVTLLRPGKEASPGEPLDVGYIGAERRGVTLTGLLHRGIYRVVGTRAAPSAGTADEPLIWDVTLAVNGDAEESDLSPVKRAQVEELAENTSVRWVGSGEEISLAGAAARGQNTWWWLAVTVLCLLVVEMMVLIPSSKLQLPN